MKRLKTFLTIIQLNYEDCEFSIGGEHTLYIGRSVSVCERKTAVDFGFRRVFRGEEIVEIFLRIYPVRVRVLELFRTRIERILNRDKNFWRARGEFVHPD